MPSQLLKNDKVGFLCARNFVYGGEQYSIGDEFPGERANNIETLVRARYVIPVVDDPAEKPRHWHLHVKPREQVAKVLREGGITQIVFDDNVKDKQVVNTIGEPQEPVEEQDQDQAEPDREEVVAATQTAQDTAAVPHGSMRSIKEWVGDDPDRAEAALASETTGKNRTTLIAYLKERTR